MDHQRQFMLKFTIQTLKCYTGLGCSIFISLLGNGSWCTGTVQWQTVCCLSV